MVAGGEDRLGTEARSEVKDCDSVESIPTNQNNCAALASVHNQGQGSEEVRDHDKEG